MNSCHRLQRQLPGFVADELAPQEMAQLRLHLRGCLECRNHASLHLQAHSALRASVSLPGVDDAFFADLHGAVMQRVAAEPAPAVPGRFCSQRLLRVAAAVALFLLGVWMFQRPFRAAFDHPLAPTAAPSPRYSPAPALKLIGSYQEARAENVGVAPFTQGMMGRAMLPRLVEVDLLGFSTLALETWRPADGPTASADHR